MMRRRSRWYVVAIFSLAAAVACAAQQREEKKSVDIQVWGIRATTKNQDISPELRALADKLKKQFKYTGFKLENRVSGSAQVGNTFSATLTGGYQARVTPQKVESRRITLQVEVVKGNESKYKGTFTLDAGTFQLQGGWPLDAGDALIVAVSAR